MVEDSQTQNSFLILVDNYFQDWQPLYCLLSKFIKDDPMLYTENVVF